MTAGRALLFINTEKAEAVRMASGIRARLAERNFETLMVNGGEGAESPCDIAFSLGGDGTVLSTVRSVAARGIPVFPVNIGSLGFLAVIQPGEWPAVFDAWLEKKTVISRRMMLDVSVGREGAPVFSASCLNDAVIHAEGIARLVNLAVEGETEKTPLGHYRSDGLIVATPTGSTAWSASAGGPILDPEIEALIINPICPFTFSNRPLVVPARERIVVRVEKEQRGGVMLTADGQKTFSLLPGDRVFVSRSRHDALLVASPRRSFYRALQNKLNWPGENPRA